MWMIYRLGKSAKEPLKIPPKKEGGRELFRTPGKYEKEKVCCNCSLLCTGNTIKK